MAECDKHCAGCADKCADSMLEEPHAKSNIKKVIGIVSGKGGVGKSLVAGVLASIFQRAGKSTAIMDADITGPSIPQMFGIKGRATGNEDGIIPAVSKHGTKIISVNLMLENPSDPVIWRGPVIAGLVKQFWTDVIWGDIDYMFIDMPPGTGDVALTVFQSVPVDGLVVVSSPQELVSMIVAKAVSMANMMNIPILGVVENMSYVQCPDCGKKIHLYGDSHIDDYCNDNGLQLLGRIPISTEIAAACDNGTIEEYEPEYLIDTAKTIANLS
jgi:Mrp family chromosome partitioning ATPase